MRFTPSLITQNRRSMALEIVAQFILLTSLTVTSYQIESKRSGDFQYNSPYIGYDVGDTKLIFSVPHGGSLEPTSIPERTVCSKSARPYRGCRMPDGSCQMTHDYSADYCGCNKVPQDNRCRVSYLRDSFTKEIATGVRNELHRLTAKNAYMVTNNLKRNKMDGNRNKSVATFGVEEAETAWEAYHERIRKTIEAINDDHVLLIDFHGQTHKEGWTEFGYALTKSDLNGEREYAHENTTICKLVEKQCGKPPSRNCFENVLRGEYSLGHYLEKEVDENGKNYVTIPSKGVPKPESGSYYSGGYNIRMYGGCRSNQVNAIQVEIPRTQRWISESREAYIPALANAIKRFMDYHFLNW